MEEESHLSLYVAAPGSTLPVVVTLQGQRFSGEVALEKLPPTWSATPAKRVVRVPSPAESAEVSFAVRVPDEPEGAVRWFDVVLREGERERRIPVQVVVARAALVAEAESGAASGAVAPRDELQLSAARAMRFDGSGKLAYDLSVPRDGTYALWFRGRWDDGASSRLAIRLDDGAPRGLSAHNVGGFDAWDSPGRADAKVFIHYGEFFSFWQWFRVGEIELTAGRHRLVISQEGPGGEMDCLVLLPQTPDMDQAANNLFQNWLFKPWESPM